MATSDEDPTEQLLTCPVCMEEYNTTDRTPRLLQCHHTFCQQCLHRLNDYGYISCSTCRQWTRCPHMSPNYLQVNFYIEQVRNCVGGALTCKKHGYQKLSFYCAKCRVSVCRDCSVLDHRDHELMDIQDALERERTNLDQLKTLAVQRRTEAMVLIKSWEEGIVHINTHTNQILSDLEKDFTLAIERLKKKMKRNMQELNSALTNFSTNKSSRRSEIAKYIRQIDTVVQDLSGPSPSTVEDMAAVYDKNRKELVNAKLPRGSSSSSAEGSNTCGKLADEAAGLKRTDFAQLSSYKALSQFVKNLQNQGNLLDTAVPVQSTQASSSSHATSTSPGKIKTQSSASEETVHSVKSPKVSASQSTTETAYGTSATCSMLGPLSNVRSGALSSSSRAVQNALPNNAGTVKNLKVASGTVSSLTGNEKKCSPQSLAGEQIPSTSVESTKAGTLRQTRSKAKTTRSNTEPYSLRKTRKK